MDNTATLILEKHLLSDSTIDFIKTLSAKPIIAHAWRGMVDIPEHGSIDVAISEVESLMTMAITFANVIMYGMYDFEEDMSEIERTEILEEQLSDIIEAYADCHVDFQITKVDLTL